MKKIVSIILLATLAGCAGHNYRPLVDRPGGNYDEDLAECQQHATNEMGAGGGAVIGTLIGAAIGAFIGHKTGFQGDFVRSGAIGGAIGGALRGNVDQAEVIKNCMRGRGHSVLR